MQYVSSFSGLKGPETPCAVFFDATLDDLPDIASSDDLDMVRHARTSTGFGDQLNPVRGQTADKYYATFLKQRHTGANLYDNCSIADQLGTYGPIGALTSGSTSYDMISTSYLHAGDYKRQIVLNPFEESYLFISENTMYGGGKSSFTETFFAYNGSALEEVSYRYPSGITGYRNPFYVEFSANTLYADVPVSFSSSVHRDPSYSTVGSGRMYYDGNIVPEDESVNLTHALAVLGPDVYPLYKDSTYLVESDLVPGTRPDIQFQAVHTDL